MHDLLEQSTKPNEGLVVCSFSFVTRGVPVMHIHPQPFIVGIKWLQQTANRTFPLSRRLSSRKVGNVGLIVLIVLLTVGVTIRSHSHLVKLYWHCVAFYQAHALVLQMNE